MAEWGVWVTVIAAGITVIGGGIFAIINRRGGERSRTIPSWVELDKANRDLRAELTSMRSELNDLRDEMQAIRDDQSRRNQAITNVLWSIAGQWPQETPPPVFDRGDLEVLGDTIPSPWRPKFA